MQKKVFIVDDNKMNLVVVKDALKDQFNATPIPSAEKMFMMMEKIVPDIILLDILMPDMDGFEAAQILKNNEQFAKIPIIFLTSTIDSDTAERAGKLGITDILTKPFEKPLLIETINKYISAG